MPLIITYSKTKRLLKRTIQTFKSYFAGGYQRLPKTPPCNPFSCTGSRGDGINTTHFNHSYKEPINTIKHLTKTAATIKRTISMKLNKEPRLIINGYEVDSKNQENKKLYHGNPGKDEDESYSKCLVTRKLKELEMMDHTNVDLVLDVEEVLYYYSRLTCPIYRDIIEKFFVEMYSGTFDLSRVENSVSTERLIKI